MNTDDDNDPRPGGPVEAPTEPPDRSRCAEPPTDRLDGVALSVERLRRFVRGDG